VIADAAVALLKEDKMKKSPFFLAVGFFKPHLPFVAPKKYWDLYDGNNIAMARNPFPPENVPKIALSDWGELRAYEDIPQVGPLTEGQARKLKQGYYACVSYTDAQIGRLLDELERQGMAKNTIIILWGDHGWKLGEHGMWCKHTNFENDAQAPLICSFPGQKMKGAHTDGLVEFVDIYPSLCELAGVPLPSHLQGKSFAPLMESPQLAGKEAAFSQFPRGRNIMGYSMRTDRYRYTEWLDNNKKVTARELYDHRIDPEENRNIEGASENAGLIKELSAALKKYWSSVN
jgi:iduronate 2-sulfatase